MEENTYRHTVAIRNMARIALLFVALVGAATAASLSTGEAEHQLQLLKSYKEEVGKQAGKIDQTKALLKDLSQDPLTNFNKVHFQFREILKTTINWNVSARLSAVQQFLADHEDEVHDYEELGKLLQEARRVISKIMDEARHDDQDRQQAILLPFDRKVPALKAVMQRFMQTAELFPQATDLLDEAVYDWEQIIKV